uniref:Non-specific lipid-transfer protein n=1 Tax=Kalanchoe fedtschenkoi TaxID=63787 RepID=A0A7N0VB46_KALFE
MAGSLKIATIFLLCIVVAQPFAAEAAITCGQVARALGPCVPYLQGGKTVPAPCCNGVRSLLAAASTTADRQLACQCLKNAAGTISNINLGNAAGLPRACGVSIPYPISRSTDCSKVK